MLLIFDAETSDLLKRGIDLDDPAQPWSVELAAELCDRDGTPLSFYSARIHADGRLVREGATAVHGITSREAAQGGVSEAIAIGMLLDLAALARVVVGHNIEFDRKVIESLLLRLPKRAEAGLAWLAGRTPGRMGRVLQAYLDEVDNMRRAWTRPGLQWVDTMLAATPFCRLRREHESGAYKWPTLDEACEILLGLPRREGPHTAWDDVQRCKRLYLALREKGAFEEAA